MRCRRRCSPLAWQAGLHTNAADAATMLWIVLLMIVWLAFLHDSSNFGITLCRKFWFSTDAWFQINVGNKQ